MLPLYICHGVVSTTRCLFTTFVQVEIYIIEGLLQGKDHLLSI